METIDGRIRKQTSTDTLASRVVYLFSGHEIREPCRAEEVADTLAAVRTALANLRSPVKHWDHIIIFIMFMKFSLETRC